mmetsp:Transcript_16461/g.15783  ORF Transcript_16461/g.15783 Transcript_16461/m.15783 type:complete len:189 (+) Transcript_16461:1186-1752(+)
MESVIKGNRQLSLKLEELQREIQHKQSEAHSLREENERLLYQSGQSEHQVDLLKEQLHYYQYKEGGPQLGALENENRDLREQLGQVSTQNKNYRSELELLQEKVKNLEHELQMYQRMSEEGSYRQREEIERLLEQGEQLRQENEDLKAQLDEELNKYRQQMDILSQLEDSNAMMQKQVDNLVASKRLL